MKNKFIIAAVAIVVLASVAYAAFTQLLTVSGTGTASGDWDVKITSITRASGTGVTDVVGTPSFTDTTATFDTELAYPGATATYDVVVTNNESIPAVLTSIINRLTATTSPVRLSASTSFWKVWLSNTT